MNTIFKLITTEIYKKYFISYFLMVGGISIIILSFGSTIISELKYYYYQVSGTQFVYRETPEIVQEENERNNPLLHEVKIKPTNPNFSIIIEKLGVNAPVIKNVSVTNEDEYFEAMKKGVAHARGKGVPGEPGNIYLFAHSSIEFWKMGPYATVFNQLRRLEAQDRVFVVYEGRTYEYKVFDKKVVQSFDTAPYEVDYNVGSILTLQTCDPPGTTLNRLIVRAYPVE